MTVGFFYLFALLLTIHCYFEAPKHEILQGSPIFLQTSKETELRLALNELEQLQVSRVERLITEEEKHVETRALEILFAAMEGTSWKSSISWLNGQHPCASGSSWFGVHCSGSGHVVGISLSKQNLIGELPHGIFSSLQELKFVDISNNNISGELPSDIGSCSKIIFFDASHNSITGYVQDFFGTMDSLRFLFLHHNQFTGSLPSSLVETQTLSVIAIHGNRVEGRPAYGRMQALPPCTKVGQNYTIPSEKDVLLDVYESLNGWSWPRNRGWEEGQAGDPCLQCWYGVTCTLDGYVTELRLPKNALYGTIPSSLSSFRHLRVIDFSSNPIFGSLPQAALYLPSLRELDMSGTFMDPFSLALPSFGEELGSLGRWRWNGDLFHWRVHESVTL
uniref:Leucine-rich repeat-containing N-terminal plant-type domain-containing protein n=2 Tax=Palpitomonas bilix TaxID=652834 RepID=A0A7S3CV35_9EUKA|mmetsp:Transcript_10603/g.27773  ORF Transcript_10603/g.27773 Transcript_10603/m.27773 type:complete len:391 (+) Transcript_10603:151-1323(+)